MLLSDFLPEERAFIATDFLPPNGPLVLTLDRFEARLYRSLYSKDNDKPVPTLYFREDRRFYVIRGVRQLNETREAIGDDPAQYPGQQVRLSAVPWIAPDGSEEHYIKIERVEPTHWRQGHYVRNPRPKK